VSNDQNADVAVVEGTELTYPIEVRAARQASATWMVDGDAAQAIVDPSGLRVTRNRKGLATCSIAAVDYIDNDLGTYHELALAFVVQPHDATTPQRPSPMKPITYIHQLPVDQAFTCAAGRQLWGFPKWVTEVTYDEDADGTHAALIEDGQLVARLHVAKGWIPIPSRPLDMTCYTSMDGVLRRTPWTTVSHGAKLRKGGATIEVGDGHPLATELRTLGVAHRKPLLSMTVSRMTATFGRAEVVEPLAG